MRRLLTSLLLAAPLTLGAQEVVTLDQSLVFNYNRTQLGLGDYTGSTTFQQATYQLNLGMPILEYRLGAVSIGGAFNYLKETTGAGQDSSFGLRSVGLGGTLFPYQPYHVSFDFSRITSPSLFGGTQVRSEAYGVGLSYMGSTIQQVYLDYRQGNVTGYLGDQTWSTLQLKGNQHFTNTFMDYRADHTEFDYQGGNRQVSTTASLDARTRLGSDWVLQDSLSTQVMEGAKSFSAGATLSGTVGAWSSASALGVAYFNALSQSGTSLYADQALARTWGRLSAFSQAGVSGQRGNGSSSGVAENVTLGLTYQLAEGWYLSADGGLASGGDLTPAGGGASTRTTATSYHAGLSWGGGVPELLRHAIFYWSDLRFQNRIQNDYPPGYVPPELATLLFERRMRREGSTQFTCDFTRLDNGTSGRQDWARVSGSLSFRSGLMFRVLGDWRRDDGFYRPGEGSQDKDLSLSASFSLPKTRVSLVWGYNHSDLENPGAVNTGAPAYLAPSPSGSVTFNSLNVDSYLGGLPWGALYLRQVDARGTTSSSLTTHVSTSFRNMAASVAVTRGWQSNGVRDSQVILSLRRWFDTIALWGPEN